MDTDFRKVITSVRAAIRASIEEHGMVSRGDRIVVGLSGGPDSTCLLHALVSLQEELGIAGIWAVHVNHGLRGAEAERDEAYSRGLAEELGVEFRAFHFDIGREARLRGVSTETAGRRARYAAFEEVCRLTGACRIATAHNRNDQAETVLMRILRGTGIRGLSGIGYTRQAGERVVIRPLLDVDREEIEGYCRSCGLIPVRDQTNEEAVYTRNKIRLELLPYLRKSYNPDIDGALVRLGRLARDEDDYLSAVTGKIMDSCWNEEEGTLSVNGITELHPALKKRVVAEAAARAGADSDVGERHIRGILALLDGKGEGKEADLPGGYYARRSYGRLWFLRRAKTATAVAPALTAPEKVRSVETTETAEAAVEAAAVKEAETTEAVMETAAATEATAVAAAETLEAAAAGGSSGESTAASGPFEVEFPSEALERSGEAELSFCGRTVRIRLIKAPSADLSGGSGAGRQDRRDRRKADADAAGIIEAAAKTAPADNSGAAPDNSGAASDNSGITAETVRGIGAAQAKPDAAPAPERRGNRVLSKTVLLDWERLKARQNLVFRCRRPGDRIRPRGMKGRKKLQDFLVDRKIPRHLRDGIPLLAEGGDIISAGGEAAAECCPNPESTGIVSIEY